MKHLRLAAVLVSAGLATGISACGGPGTAARGGGVIDVVAAENTWGSLAAQLGGSKVDVVSVVSDPNADPHEYESNPTDARDFVQAKYVIVNGAGYDGWATQLLSAQSVAGRRVLDVAQLLGKHDGDNPHFWYGPSYVYRVIDRITSDYEAIDPADKAYFQARHRALEASFAPYRQSLAYLHSHFAHTPVASTESIFAYLASYLDLDLVTPPTFMQAVAEGNDPSAPSVARFYDQIKAKDFSMLVYNVQTVTPLTTSIRAATAARDVPVVGVSETIQPPIDDFEQWMVGQFSQLANALNARALGR